MISVVFPAYNEEANVAELHRRIVAALGEAKEPFEIIAVENASHDRTREELLRLNPVTVIGLAYNIGQTAALDAGIHHANGDIIVTLDADLQNDPADIPRLIAKLREGYDVVAGWRKDRHDSFGRRMFSRFANWLARTVLGLSLHDYACALKAFRKEFIGDAHLYGEMHVFLAAILHYRGARVVELEVRHHPRSAGLSKHTFIKGAKDVADLFTIKFIMGTSRPLVVFLGMGLASWGIAGLAIAVSFALKLAEIRNFGQTPLPIVASLFITVGLLVIMMGFLAELVLRVYYESHGKTPYVIREIIKKP